jgi:hypothetical protein
VGLLAAAWEWRRWNHLNNSNMPPPTPPPGPPPVHPNQQPTTKPPRLENVKSINPHRINEFFSAHDMWCSNTNNNSNQKSLWSSSPSLPLLQLQTKEKPNQNQKIINDPSAGSPTETLLRLLLPLDDGVQTSSRPGDAGKPRGTARPIPGLHRSVQSVEATGGVYKGQGRNRRWLMTNAY